MRVQGGVMEKDEERIKTQLTRVIDTLAKTFPDASRVSADLWKFAKTHDRRNYQLIRFAMAAVSDYRTVAKAIRELARRIQSGNTPSLLDTLTPFLYRSSSLVFNRSHIPAIMEFARTDEKGLANTAHEMLKEISSRNPEVLEAQVQEMCKDLEAQAPSAKSADDTSAEEILKACSGFAKKLPAKLPKERRFLQALMNYALYSSSPRAAKHAVSIIMAVAEKKEMYAKDLVQKCLKNWKYGSDHFLTRLGTIAQLNLLAPRETDAESGAIVSIAIDQILLTNRSKQSESGYTWSEEVDEETSAKEWALKIIINRLRGMEDPEEAEFRTQAEPVYSTLNKLVTNEGELSKKKDTPGTQKSRLRLYAAKLLIKLCAYRSLCEKLLSPSDFNSLALVAQDRLLPVRAGFVDVLRKKLSQQTQLSVRWYAIPCLLAFEPSATLKESTLTWLRSRAMFFSRQTQTNGKRSEQQTVMESMFARLLSLLAYHPDYPPSNEDERTRMVELADFARYILFYLAAVANENNLSLIFHIAQRVKQARDGITRSDEITTRLHTLSDLAQATIRRFADIYSQQHKIGGASGIASILETYPGKMRLPNALFAAMSSHQEAQDVADKNFLPEDIEDVLDDMVRSWMRPKKTSQTANQGKKRKSEHSDANGDSHATKKVRKQKSLSMRKVSSAAGNAKMPKKKRKDEDGWGSDYDGEEKASGAQRRSSRSARKEVAYADRDSDEDDLEMEEWDEEDEPEDEGEDEIEDDAENQDGTGDEAKEQESDNDQNGDQDSEMTDVDEISSPSRRKAKSVSTRKMQSSSPVKTKSAPEKATKTEALPVRRSNRRG
jgi:sister-chromatid-cohesion protein PDS5